uniref:Putative secreted protein n=1 Tax=Anopheles darlingi TaxID=43151 RepID=A0A2M4D948_ANODA
MVLRAFYLEVYIVFGCSVADIFERAQYVLNQVEYYMCCIILPGKMILISNILRSKDVLSLTKVCYQAYGCMKRLLGNQ